MLAAAWKSVARRRQDNWFLGSMTGWTGRTMDVPLDFLGPGRYRAEVYADADDAAENPKNVAISTLCVDRTARLRLADRGVIKTGMWGDIVIFNPDTIADVAKRIRHGI